MTWLWQPLIPSSVGSGAMVGSCSFSFGATAILDGAGGEPVNAVMNFSDELFVAKYWLSVLLFVWS